MDYSSHTFRSLSTGWGVSHYPEEAVGGPLGSQTALHTRRELVPPANSEVIIIITCLLSEHENMNRDIQRIQGYTHMYCVKIKYKVHFVNLSLNVANSENKMVLMLQKSQHFNEEKLSRRCVKQTVDPTFQRWRCDTGPPPCQHPCRVDHLWGGRGYHTALFDVSSLRLHSDSMTPSSSSNHPLPLCTKPHCRREHNQTCLESACTVYIVLNYVVIDKSKSFGIFPPVVELYYKK